MRWKKRTYISITRRRGEKKQKNERDQIRMRRHQEGENRAAENYFSLFIIALGSYYGGESVQPWPN